MSGNPYLPISPMAPMFLNIASITNTKPMKVTVSTPNAYVSGQLAYFSIPFDYGMYQLNGLTAQILSVDNTNTIFTIGLDASQFDPFTAPTGLAQPATLSPAGARNIYNNTTVPFHAVNGLVGN